MLVPLKISVLLWISTAIHHIKFVYCIFNLQCGTVQLTKRVRIKPYSDTNSFHLSKKLMLSIICNQTTLTKKE